MKRSLLFPLLAFLLVVLIVLNIFCGSVSIPASKVLAILSQPHVSSTEGYIIWHLRIPQTVVALLSGMALAVSGLYLQTLFSNPLADGSILGIQSGAGLGAGLIFLLTGGSLLTLGTSNVLWVILAAFIGAVSVILILLFISTLVRSSVVLLIAGVMLSYIISSTISLLSYMADAESLRMFFVWGMGSFSTVSVSYLGLFSITLLIGILASIFLLKPMNALLLGNAYASNLGISLRKTRIQVLLVVGWLTAIVTAFCGPVAFVGLAAPHVARILLRTNNHLSVLPATMLIGALMTLLCLFCSFSILADTLLAINVVTPFICVPVILYVIINKQNNYL